MDTDIYYFTGTGNSLAVAREIAERTNGNLISIASVIDEPSIHTAASTIGIVFPAYLAHLHGIPLIVESFVVKLADIGTKHIFAVCTCGGYEHVNALPTLKRLAKIITSAGGRLGGKFSVRFPMNNLDYGHIPVPIEKNQEVILEKSREKIIDICRRIVTGKKTGFGFFQSLWNLFMTPMYRLLRKPCLSALKRYAKEPGAGPSDFRRLIYSSDKSIYADEKCNGCGTCVRVCPVRNIRLIDERPVWLHHCEMCYACDEWCPQEAIHHWGRAPGIKYRHPDVTLSDMYEQSRKRRQGTPL